MGKLIAAKGYKKLPTVQKIAQSGNTAQNASEFVQYFFRRMFSIHLLDGVSDVIIATNFVLRIKDASVTGWLDYFSTFAHYKQRKCAQKH